MARTQAGSRMHVLDWVDGRGGDFALSLTRLLEPSGAIVTPGSAVMPRGHTDPTEALLCRPCEPMIPLATSAKLRAWWLAVDHPMAADPNWDLVTSATFPGGRPGLVLVEAKAHLAELSNEAGGKRQKAGSNSANHDRIGLAIEEARRGLGGEAAGVHISRDRCYQFSNRVAFAWKLASEGVPVALVYLGFTGDESIAGAPGMIRDLEHWRTALRAHTAEVLPGDYWERIHTTVAAELWLLAGTLPVARQSPPIDVRRSGRFVPPVAA